MLTGRPCALQLPRRCILEMTLVRPSTLMHIHVAYSCTIACSAGMSRRFANLAGNWSACTGISLLSLFY